MGIADNYFVRVLWRIGENIKACFGGWWGILGGPALFAIGFAFHWFAYRRWPDLSGGKPMDELAIFVLYLCIPFMAILAIAVFVNIFLAPVQIDHEQREGHQAETAKLAAEVNRLQSECAHLRKELADTKPRLSLALGDLLIGDCDEDGASSISMVAGVGNNGAPSVARDWRLVVTLADGTTLTASPVAFTQGYWITTGNHLGLLIVPGSPPPVKIFIRPEDALHTKAMQRIDKHDEVVGRLRFIIANITPDRFVGGTLELSCADMLGERCAAVAQVVTRPWVPLKYPGMDA